MNAVARTLAQIDQALDIERAIWIMERRGGDNSTEARASKAKLDALLDERSAAQREANRPLGSIA